MTALTSMLVMAVIHRTAFVISCQNQKWHLGGGEQTGSNLHGDPHAPPFLWQGLAEFRDLQQRENSGHILALPLAAKCSPGFTTSLPFTLRVFPEATRLLPSVL